MSSFQNLEDSCLAHRFAGRWDWSRDDGCTGDTNTWQRATSTSWNEIGLVKTNSNQKSAALRSMVTRPCPNLIDRQPTVEIETLFWKSEGTMSKKRTLDRTSVVLSFDMVDLHNFLRVHCLAWPWLGAPSLEHFDMGHTHAVQNIRQNRDIHKMMSNGCLVHISPAMPTEYSVFCFSHVRPTCQVPPGIARSWHWRVTMWSPKKWFV